VGGIATSCFATIRSSFHSAGATPTRGDPDRNLDRATVSIDDPQLVAA